MGIIENKGIEFKAYHRHFKIEKIGNKFIVE
jgi:hypothetical protein